MTAVIITASQEKDWVRPLAALRARGVACVVIALDPHSFAVRVQRRPGDPHPAPEDPEALEAAQRARALRHALAEFELPMYALVAGRPLAEALAG